MNSGTFNSGSLVVTFQIGTDENSDPITISHTFRSLNPNASAQALHATAAAFGTLLGYPVINVERIVREYV